MAPLEKNMEKELVKWIVRRSWWDVVRTYIINPETRTLKIPRTEDTALHVAVTEEREYYALIMIFAAGSDVLKIGNKQDDTPLHLAAKFGNTYLCKSIAEKNVALIGAVNKFGETPLFSAASRGKTQAFLYLHHLAKDKQIETCTTRNNGDTILHSAISQDYFDLAYIIIKEYPKLVHLPNKNGLSPLHLLATKPSAFPSGVQLFGIRKLVYRCVRVQKLAKMADLAKAPNPQLRWNSQWRPRKGLTLSGMQDDFMESIGRAIFCIYDPKASSTQVLINKMKNQQDEESTNTQGHGEIDQQDEEAANEQVDYQNNQQDEESTYGKGHGDEAANEQGSGDITPGICILFKYCLIYICIGMLVCIFCPYVLLRITFVLPKNIFGYEEYARIKHTKEICVWSVEVMNKLIESGHADQSHTVEVMNNLTESEHNADQSHTVEVMNNLTESEHNADQSHTVEVMNNLIESEHAYEQCEMQPKPPKEEGQSVEGTIKIEEKLMFMAAKHGISEMVLRILDDNPGAIFEVNADKKNILMLAVEYRHHRLYDDLLDNGIINRTILEHVDKDGNTLLHIAANLEEGQQFWRNIRGAALHMHMEIKWYEFVKEAMPPYLIDCYNKHDKTPREIFQDSHRPLIKEARQWLTNTSQSCSVVAALIATVAFAASTTVPGGLKQDNGVPSLEHEPFFILSASSALLALSFSMISVVMFLGILTSSFDLKDFRKDLPFKLLLGLVSLLISIVSMIVSFYAGHYFVLKQESNHNAALVYGLLCSFLLVFIISKFPLDYELVRTTLRSKPFK